MQTLKKNITCAFGKKGSDWIDALPALVKTLSEYWLLSNVNSVNKMSWNYVATAIQNDIVPVVLKISCDPQLILDEYNVLKHFDGAGSVNVIDFNLECNAMLLEQAMPGETLKEKFVDVAGAIFIYTNIVNVISEKPFLKNKNFKHVSDWLSTINNIVDDRIEKRFVEKAKTLMLKLQNTVKDEYLCHGDLHFENIISKRLKWIAIDPKGIIAEKAFEVSAFDLMSEDESDISAQVKLLSLHLNLNSARLLAWMFLRSLISAQWFIEDNGDPSRMLIMLKSLYPLLKSIDEI